MTVIRCSKCGETDEAKFYPSRLKQGSGYCQKCTNEQSAAYRRTSKGSAANVARVKAYRIAHPEKAREWGRNSDQRRRDRAREQELIRRITEGWTPPPSKVRVKKCRGCGETDEAQFSPTSWYYCRSCARQRIREYRASLTPHCTLCGVTDPALFYPSMPLACKVCHKRRSEGRRNTAKRIGPRR